MTLNESTCKQPPEAGGVPEAAKSRRQWPTLSDDLGMLGRSDGKLETGRIAIASYEFTGVVRNGGIGTACTELAKALTRDGHDVDLVFTGWWSQLTTAQFQSWQRQYHKSGIRLTRVDPAVSGRFDAVIPSAAHSMALYQMLKAQDEESPYDVIHFVESLGHGFYSLLAKRQGLAFERATTVVGIHSPRRWIAEAHSSPFDLPMDVADEFLEDRSIEMADVVISPSHFMLNWLRQRGVGLPPRSYVQQYVTHFDKRSRTSEARMSFNGEPKKIEELVFFGRLEPRKGIVAFCDALDVLAKKHPGQIRQVTFLGKNAMPVGYIEDRAEKWPWGFSVLDELDREAALEYLRADGRLAVMASTMDNSPNVIYEAIGLGIPFLASRGGGSGELVHLDDRNRFTYDPLDPEVSEIDPANPSRCRPCASETKLAERLGELLEDQFRRPARFAVPPASNREVHLKWHRAAIASHATSDAKGQEITRPATVSVLDLASAGDWSADTFLILDSDTEPEPQLVEFITGVAAACPDAAFVTPLGTFDVATSEMSGRRLYVPTGGPAAIGLLGNCMGAGAVLARRDALKRLGCLDGSACAHGTVAELLLGAVLAGERIEVLPEALYHLSAPKARSGLLSRSEDPARWLRPYHLHFSGDAAQIAALGSRVLRDEPELRGAAVHAAGTSQQLAEIMASRSWRMTAWFRRVGSATRSLMRRWRG